MKCKQCGANMTLEDEYCPYCGAVNPGARQHMEDMKRFRTDYSQTKESVLKSVEKQKHSHAEILVICILAVLNIGLIAVRANRQDLQDWMKKKQMWLHREEIAAVLDQYEADNDFYAMAGSEYRYDLYDVGQLDEYMAAVSMAGECADFFDDLYYLKCGLTELMPPENCISFMGGAVHRFYQDYGRKGSSFQSERYGKHLPFMENMKQKLEGTLTVQCGFTAEDIAGLGGMSRREIENLLEKRMHIDEE